MERRRQLSEGEENLFRFIQHFESLRRTTVRRFSAYEDAVHLADLPEHENVSFRSAEGARPGGETLLSISKPSISIPPEPGEYFKHFLRRESEEMRETADDYFRYSIATVGPNEKETAKEAQDLFSSSSGDDFPFSALPKEAVLAPVSSWTEAVQLWQKARGDMLRWKKERMEWAREAAASQKVKKVYERLYEMHSKTQRDERLEVIVGDGFLNWHAPGGKGGGIRVNHPLIIRRAELSFDTGAATLTLQVARTPSSIYFSALRGVERKSAGSLRAVEAKVEGLPLLNQEKTESLLKEMSNIISSRGRYVGKMRFGGGDFGEHPRMSSDPVLFIRKKTRGAAESAEGIVKGGEIDDAVSDILDRLSGDSSTRDGSRGGKEKQKSSGKTRVQEDDPLYLCKPANDPQRQTVRAVKEGSGVLVQGPPGTGKTHTIANLIGDLLARGKRILVTGEKAKALAPIRKNLPEEIRELCVSNVGSSREERKRLERSVNAMVSKIGKRKRSRKRNGRRRRKEGRWIGARKKLKKKERLLYEAIRFEHEEHLVDGERLSSGEVAKKLGERKEALSSYPPVPKDAGRHFPIGPNEREKLAGILSDLSENDRRYIAAGLPDLTGFPIPKEFSRQANLKKKLESKKQARQADLWEKERRVKATVGQLRDVAKRARNEAGYIKEAEEWERLAYQAGREGGKVGNLWKTLFDSFRSMREHKDESAALLVEYQPGIRNGGHFSAEDLRLLEEVTGHLASGGSLGFFCLNVMHRDWRSKIEERWVLSGGKKPTSEKDFHALREAAVLEEKKSGFISQWSRMAGESGEALVENVQGKGDFVSVFASFLNRAREAFSRGARGKEVEKKARELGFQVSKARIEEKEQVIEEESRYAEWKVDARAMNKIGNLLNWECIRKRRAQVQKELGEAIGKARTALSKQRSSGKEAAIFEFLKKAAESLDAARYRKVFRGIEALQEKEERAREARRLLDKIEAASPLWERAVRNGEVALSGEKKWNSVWRWKQVEGVFLSASETDVGQLSKEVNDLKQEIEKATLDLVEEKAWNAHVTRMQSNENQHQALITWSKLMKEVGRGTGKSAPKIEQNAREVMKECRGAVPVWVMPLDEVFRSFPSGQKSFDVVIVDEASQVGIDGILLMTMAEKIVVVGDDEQVVPSGAGINKSKVEELQDEYLQGVMARGLFQADASLYKIAGSLMGSPVKLREHFRSVPSIISYSNELSYSGEIKPLRGRGDTKGLGRALVSHRVREGRSEKKVNREEALTIVSLALAACRDRAYKGMTMGAVCLLGNAQAEIIDQVAREKMYASEYEDCNFLAGNAAQFQGEERDVMFLSVVKSPKEATEESEVGPLRLVSSNNSIRKRRFNVAASRAKHQMWVVHSLNPRKDLKQDDLRRKLIEHAEDPDALTDLLSGEAQKTDSPFERRVMEHLVKEGYRVEAQVESAGFSIDLVVKDESGNSLAIECDGERWHGPEKTKQDMERQSILERIGWSFCRIRGSLFFRDEEEAMARVFGRLERMGIKKSEDLVSAGNEEARGVADREKEEVYVRIERKAAALRKKWKKQDRGTEEKKKEEAPAASLPFEAV